MKLFFNCIDKFIERVFKRIEKTCQIDTIDLAYIRILSGTFFLLVYPPNWQWIGDIPPTFFNPPVFSLANLTNGFPSATFFLTTEVVSIILLFFITIGFFTRVSAIILFFLFLICLNYVYSFGRIDHGILLLITLICLAFTNAGTSLAMRKDSIISERIQLVSLSLLGICIAFGMFTAGLDKMLKWIDFDLTTSGFLSWYYPNYYMYGYKYLLAKWIPFIPQFIIEIGEYLVVLLEISGFIWLLVGKKAWSIWLFLLCFFHLTTHLTLNIPFAGHILVYGVFLLPPLPSSIKKWHVFLRNRVVFMWGVLTSFILIIRLYESIFNQLFFDYQWFWIYGNLFLWILMILISSIALTRKLFIVDR